MLSISLVSVSLLSLSLSCFISATPITLPSTQSVEDNTPLHLAAAAGHTHCARLLLDNGASLSIRNADGRTPLEEAVHAGHSSLAELVRNAAVRIIELHWSPRQSPCSLIH